MKRSTLLGVLAGVTLLAAGGWLTYRQRKAAALLEANRWRVPVEVQDPVRGPRNARVTLVEFCDFEVVECGTMAPILARVVHDFTPNARWVFKDFPEETTHPRGFVAAHLGRYVFNQSGDAGFWPAHDVMFKVLRGLREPLSVNLAQQLGLRWDDIAAAVTAEPVAQPIRTNLAIGQASGVTAVPYLFVNGRPLAGVVSYEVLADVVRDELGRAERLLTSAGNVKDPYAELTKRARVPNPDPRLAAPPPKEDDDEDEERQAAAPTPAAANSGTVTPERPPSPLPHVVPKTGTLKVADLSPADEATLKSRGFDPQAFVGFANTMNEQHREEEALRADRRAKGLPAGPEETPKPH